MSRRTNNNNINQLSEELSSLRIKNVRPVKKTVINGLSNGMSKLRIRNSVKRVANTPINNNFPRPQKKPRKQVNSTRSKPTEVNDLYIVVKIPVKILQSLKRISLFTDQKRREYMGVIDLRKGENGDVVFEPPSRQTSGNRGTVKGNYSKIDNAYMSYHSHPGVMYETSASGNKHHTLPSEADIIKYIDNYPNMQINLILDTHGYYVIDFIETRLYNRPRKEQFLNFFKRSSNNTNLASRKYINDGYEYYTCRSVNMWKTIVDRIFANTVGMSIKFYPYDESADITLVNKEYFQWYNVQQTNRRNNS